MLSSSLSTSTLDLSRAPAGCGKRILMHNPDEQYIEQYENELQMMGASAKDTLTRATQRIGDQLSSIMSTAFLQLKTDISNRKLYVMYEDILHCDIRTDHTQARSVLPIFERFIDKAEMFLQTSFSYFLKKEIEYCIVDCISKHIQEHENDTLKILDLTIAFSRSQLMSNVNELAKNSIVDARLAEKASFLSEIVRLKEMLFQKNKIGDMYLAETEKSKRLLLKLMRNDYVEYGQSLGLKDILLRGAEKKKEVEEAISAIELEKMAKISQKRLEMLSGNDTLSSSGEDDSTDTNDLSIRQTRGQLMDKLQHKNAYIAHLEETAKVFKLLQKDYAEKVKELNAANEETFKLNLKYKELEQYFCQVTGMTLSQFEKYKDSKESIRLDANLVNVSDSSDLKVRASTLLTQDTSDKTTINKRSVFDPKDLLIDKLNEDVKALEKLLNGDAEDIYAELRRYRANEFQHRRKILTYKRLLEFDHGKRSKSHPITGFESFATPLAIDKQLDMLYWIRKALLKIFGIKIKDADSENTILRRLNKTLAENYINLNPEEFNSSFDSEGSIDWEGDIAAEKRLSLNSVLDPDVYNKRGTKSGSVSMRTPSHGWMPNLSNASKKSTGHRNSTLLDPSQPELYDTPIRFHLDSNRRHSMEKLEGYYDCDGNFLGTDIFCPHCGKYVDATAITYSIDDAEENQDICDSFKVQNNSSHKQTTLNGTESVTPLGSIKKQYPQNRVSHGPGSRVSGSHTSNTLSDKDQSYNSRIALDDSLRRSSYNRGSKKYVYDPSMKSSSPPVSMRVRFGSDLKSTMSIDPLTITELKASQLLTNTVIAPDLTDLYNNLQKSDKQRFEHILFKQNIAKKRNPRLCEDIKKELTPLFLSTIKSDEVDTILGIPSNDPCIPDQVIYDSSLDDSFINYIDDSTDDLNSLEFSDAPDSALFTHLYKTAVKSVIESTRELKIDMPASFSDQILENSIPVPPVDTGASDGFISISGNRHCSASAKVLLTSEELFTHLLSENEFQHFLDVQGFNLQTITIKDVQAYIAVKEISSTASLFKSYCSDPRLLEKFTNLPEFSDNMAVLDVSISSDTFESEFFIDQVKSAEPGILFSHIENHGSMQPHTDTLVSDADHSLSKPLTHELKPLRQTRCSFSRGGTVHKRSPSIGEVLLDPLSPMENQLFLSAKLRPYSSPCNGYVTINGLTVQLYQKEGLKGTISNLVRTTMTSREYKLPSRQVLKRLLPSFYESDKSYMPSLTPKATTEAGNRAHSTLDAIMDDLLTKPLCKKELKVISHERSELLKDVLKDEIKKFKYNRVIKLFLQEQVFGQILGLKQELKKCRTRHRLMRNKRRVLAAKKVLFIKHLHSKGPADLVASLDVLEQYASNVQNEIKYTPLSAVASVTGDWIVNADISIRHEDNLATAVSLNEPRPKSSEFGYLCLSATKSLPPADTAGQPLLEEVHDLCENPIVKKEEAVAKELEGLEKTSALAQQLLEKIRQEIRKAIDMVNKGVQSPEGLIDEDYFDAYASERTRKREDLAVEIANNLFRESAITNKSLLFMKLPIKSSEVGSVEDVFQRLYDEAAAINEKLRLKRLRCVQELIEHYNKLHNSITRPSEVTEFLRIKYFGNNDPTPRYNYHHHGVFVDSLNKNPRGLIIPKRPINGGLTVNELELLEQTNIVDKKIQLSEKTANMIRVIFGNLGRAKSTGQTFKHMQSKGLMMGPGKFTSWQDVNAEFQELIDITKGYSLGLRGQHYLTPASFENLGTIGRSAIVLPQNLTVYQIENLGVHDNKPIKDDDFTEAENTFSLSDVHLGAPLGNSVFTEQSLMQQKIPSGVTQESASGINSVSILHERDNTSSETQKVQAQIQVGDTCGVTSSSIFTAQTTLFSAVEDHGLAEDQTKSTNLPVAQNHKTAQNLPLETEIQRSAVHQKLNLTLPKPFSRTQSLSSRKVLQAIHAVPKTATGKAHATEGSRETERYKDVAGMKFTINTMKLEPVASPRVVSRLMPSAVHQRSTSSLQANSSYQTPLPSLVTATSLHDVTIAPTVALGNKSNSFLADHKESEELASLRTLTQSSRSRSATEKLLELSDLQPLPSLHSHDIRQTGASKQDSDTLRLSCRRSTDIDSNAELVELGGII